MAVKALLRRVLGEYAYYGILRVDPASANQPVDVQLSLRQLGSIDELRTSPHPEVAQLVGYDGAQAKCFVAEEAGEIVAACWYWFGETYQRRNFWPLGPNEAKLVQITSAITRRGRGVADALIRYSAARMFESGFEALYARVWHSHGASRRFFEKAGWRNHAKVVEMRPFDRRIRIVWWI